MGFHRHAGENRMASVIARDAIAGETTCALAVATPEDILMQVSVILVSG